MTIQKIIVLVGLISILAFPGALMAGSVKGMDWYSMETGKPTNTIERVIPSNLTAERSTSGMDWYTESDAAVERRTVNHPSYVADRAGGNGMDWYSEDATRPVGAAKDCTPSGTLVAGVNNC